VRSGHHFEKKAFLRPKPFGTLPASKLQQIEKQVKLAFGLIS